MNLKRLIAVAVLAAAPLFGAVIAGGTNMHVHGNPTGVTAGAPMYHHA
jgi:hypothetical protein